MKRLLILVAVALALVATSACKKSSEESAQSQEQQVAAPLVGEWQLDVERTVALLPQEQRGLAAMMMGQMSMVWVFNEDGSMSMNAESRGESRSYNATYEVEPQDNGDLAVTLHPTEETLAEIRANTPEGEEVAVERQLRVTTSGESLLRAVRLSDEEAEADESAMIFRRVGSEVAPEEEFAPVESAGADEAVEGTEEQVAALIEEQLRNAQGTADGASTVDGEEEAEIAFTPEFIQGTWRFDADTTLASLSEQERAFGEMIFRQIRMNMTLGEDGAMRMFVGAMSNYEELVGTWEVASSEGASATLIMTPDLEASRNPGANRGAEPMMLEIYNQNRVHVREGEATNRNPMVLRRVPAEEVPALLEENDRLLESAPPRQGQPTDDSLPIAQTVEGGGDEGEPTGEE